MSRTIIIIYHANLATFCPAADRGNNGFFKSCLLLRSSADTKKTLTEIREGLLLINCRIKTSYFLWHLLQLAASFALKALVPLWQVPQNLPSLMSFMVMTSPPFFILKTAG